MNGSEADKLALNIRDTAAKVVLSENKASAKTRILEVFVSFPATAALSGIDTTTPTFAYKVERSEGHCRNIALVLKKSPSWCLRG
jgi:hypothetical protein